MKTKPLTILIVLLAALALVACSSGGGTQGQLAQTTGTGTPASNSLTPILITITATPTPSATPAPPAPTATPPSTNTPTATASPAPTPSPTPTTTPGRGTPQAEVVSPELNVRQGPGVAYPAITTAKASDLLDVTGVNAARDWLQVTLADGTTGWISGKPDYARVQGALDGVPVVAVAPPPQPALGAASATSGASGGKLVFMTSSGGDIYIINADGSGLRRLVSGGIDPILSPDGQQVAYTSWDNTQKGALGSLWVINADGSGQRVILSEVNQPKSPTWSPDGTQVAINMQQGGWTKARTECGSPGEMPPEAKDVKPVLEPNGTFDKLCWRLPANPFWGLRLINVAAGTFEDLPRDTHSFGPTWDPRNSWRIVYRGDKGLVQLDLGKSTTSAFTDDVDDHSPVFSPDGSRLAVSYMQHDHWDIHVMNGDGSGRARLTETPLSVIVDQQLAGQTPRSWNNAAPTWSPDGSQIAFLSDRSGKWEIWVMNADGSNQHPMFAPDTLKGITLQYNGVDERMLSWGR